MAAEELGRIEKPAASTMINKRKLYVVPLVYPIPGAPSGLATRLEQYWRAIDSHLGRLEARIGNVRHIYHEGISDGGETGLDRVKDVNTPAYPFLRDRVNSGAIFETFEDEGLLLESVDWGRCLQLGLASRKVAEVVHEAFQKASEARLKHVSETIDKTLDESQAGLLITSSARGIDIPSDVEHFNIMPPEFDDLMRWMQEDMAREMAAASESQAEAKERATPGSGLWTPGSP